MHFFNILLTFILVSTVVFGCTERRKGPMERAGERIDEIGDNIRDGDAPLKKKGPLEKAGESIDDTLNGRR